LPAARTSVRGTVGEILPSADPQSRTFEVRVNFDPVAGVHPGMFGRLLVPIGDREVVRVPAAAIDRTGQLETVLVQSDGIWTRRLVTTGAVLADGFLEVLSGLEGGETIGLPAA
jgi:multidrug efflux pump subunit AcrA (membrane-fusion protein)